MVIYAPYLLYVLYCIIIVRVEQLYVDTYLCIDQYIFVVGCIIYHSFIPNIITNI
jgi:hypothetical protein